MIDFILHIDEHLKTMVANYGTWTYVILFAIIFCETGLVIMPFLPGDSLLFAAGALAATPESGLNVWYMMGLLIIAGILGDTVNYHVGRYLGPRVMSGALSRWINIKHFQATEAFFEKHGGKTIIFARFLPFIRTFAPFVAGVGKMNYSRFLMFNVVGAIVWVVSFVMLGYFFGKIPIVEERFSLVVLGIIGVSVLPMFYELIRHRFFKSAKSVDKQEVPAGSGTK